MKNIHLLLPLLILTQDAPPKDTREELVRNGGFEWVEEKTPAMDGISSAIGWSHVTLGLPELFCKEASAKNNGIPENLYGTMEPKEGDHYAGFFAWKDDVRRNWGGDGEDAYKPGWNVYSEYMQAELVKPLVAGVEYEVVFHVALSGYSDRAVSALGAYLSPRSLKYDHRRFLDEKPQVHVERIMDERSKWVEVKGTFEADGGERFIVIGTWPYAGFDTKKCIEELDNQYAYYYLDGISVKAVPPPAE